MYSRTQFARGRNTVLGLSRQPSFYRRSHFFLAVGLCVFIFSCGPALRAQQNGTMIGQVEGNDISVEGGAGAADLKNGSLPSGGSAPGQPSVFSISNGSVVTVHVGQARMALAGGQIDICGPAKFTVLESGGAITLALNFGRMRVQIPASAALRIFTPTIVATPLDIGGAVRDVTVGLDLNDSLCVLSSSGAIRLEQQFSGEGLIVPQSGEFFLAGGSLVPVAGAPGSCECTPFVARATPPPAPVPSQPVPAQNALPTPMVPPVLAQVQPEVAVANTAVAEPAAPRNRVQIGELARANEMRPVPPPENNVEPTIPDITLPEYTVMLQPLVMSVTPSPLRPAEAPADTAMLVRVARVAPEWEFSGRVAAPEFAADMQRALGQKASAPQPQASPASQPAKKKRGFWASIKSIFVGSDETRK